MKLSGEHRLEFPRETVWRALLDPAVLARTLPGCEKLETSGDNEFDGVLNVQVGPVKGAFQGKLALSDLRPPEGYRLKLDGSGTAGFVRGEGTLRLAETDGGTTLTYEVDTQVGGRLAGVGQRLLESASKSIARQGIEGLARELAAGAGTAEPGADAAAQPPSAAPTAAAVAAQVARDVAADLVPPPRRIGLLLALVAVAAVFVVLILRSC